MARACRSVQQFDFTRLFVVVDGSSLTVEIDDAAIRELETGAEQEELAAFGPDREHGPAAGREYVACLQSFAVADAVIFQTLNMANDRQTVRNKDIQLPLFREPARTVLYSCSYEAFNDRAAKRLI